MELDLKMSKGKRTWPTQWAGCVWNTRTELSTQQEQNPFPNVQSAFSGQYAEHVLGHTISFNREKKIEIIHTILSDPNGMRWEISSRRESGKFSNMYKFNNTLLTNGSKKKSHRELENNWDKWKWKYNRPERMGSSETEAQGRPVGMRGETGVNLLQGNTQSHLGSRARPEGPSPRAVGAAEPPHTSVSAFWPPEWWENKFTLF